MASFLVLFVVFDAEKGVVDGLIDMALLLLLGVYNAGPHRAGGFPDVSFAERTSVT